MPQVAWRQLVVTLLVDFRSRVAWLALGLKNVVGGMVPIALLFN